MEYTIITSGILIAVALILLFAIKGDNWYHTIGRLLMVLLLVSAILLLAKSTLDNKTRCFPVVNESIDLNSSNTIYTYDKFCYDEANTTADTFYDFTFTLLKIGLFMLLIIGFYILFMGIKRKAGLK